MEDLGSCSPYSAMEHPESASLQAAMEFPVTASLGPMGPLLRQLHSRPKGVDDDKIQLLNDDIGGLCITLMDVSEAKDACFMAKWWMKEVRELCYDTEDYLGEAMMKSRAGSRSSARLSTIFRVGSKLEWRPQIGKGVQGRRGASRLKKIFTKRRNLKPQPKKIMTSFVELMARAEHLDDVSERFKLGLKAIKPDYAQASISRLTPRLPHQLPASPTSTTISVHRDARGFPGVGKTTVASTLYHNFRWKFHCRAFVRVSRTPDMIMILTSILSQIKAPQVSGYPDAQDLIDNIRKHLQGNRYFIVIDDLWTTSAWNIISRAFPDDECCSRIVTTTGLEDIALACCSYHLTNIFQMSPLSYVQSKELFFSRFFGSEDGCPPKVREVSYGIIKKCEGSPLAIVSAASLLAWEPNLSVEEWVHTEDSLSCIVSTSTSEGIKEVLNLIYNNLPPPLKTCLLYLGMYPDGCTIGKGDLVKQWVAEGFLNTMEGQDTEIIAGAYFEELVRRGLVQVVDPSYSGEVLFCTVHQMVLDFIRDKSVEENFAITVDYFQSTLALHDKVRRLSVQFGGAKSGKIPEGIIVSHVRSLLFCGFFKCVPSIAGYGLLRVLILHIWADQDKVFDLSRIDELFQLTYLKIECNITIKLPAKIRGLRYLETLEIDARLSAVPSDIVHLERLLHLRLPGECKLPDGVGHMEALRTLGYFDIGGNSEYNVLDLCKLSNLQDLHLTCSTVQKAENLQENMSLLGSIFGKLSSLQSVTLVNMADPTVNTLQDGSSMSIFCESLSYVSPNPVLLERFELLSRIFIFRSLPMWFAQLGRLRILKIAVWELCGRDIDILKALPALTCLSLYVRTVPSERIVFDKAGFLVLNYFKFRCSVPRLKFEAGAMPNLLKLKLSFNAARVEQQDNAAISIEHLSAVKEISAKIGGAGADAESALTATISNHPSNPTINVKFVDWLFPGDPSMVTKEKQHITQDKDQVKEKEKSNQATEDTDLGKKIRAGVTTAGAVASSFGAIRNWTKTTTGAGAVTTPATGTLNVNPASAGAVNASGDPAASVTINTARAGSVTVTDAIKVGDVPSSYLDIETVEVAKASNNHAGRVTPAKISASTSDEVIRFDPPELCFPMVPDKPVLSSFKIINTTESYVSFFICKPGKEATGQYSSSKVNSILPPRSMECLSVIRNEKEGAVENMQFNEEFNVWYAIVGEDIEADDLDLEDHSECKKLHIVLTKGSPCTSKELIQLDPPQLSLPFMPNKPLVFSVNIINNTDYCVAFNKFFLYKNLGDYNAQPFRGVIPPRSTQRMVVKRVPKKKEHEDMQREVKFGIWSSIVSEPVESSHITECASVKGWKELPIVYNKTTLGTTDELIQFDPPHLPFTFHPNKRVPNFRLFKIVNVTDHNVGFSTWSHEDNSASYIMEPPTGILPPKSTQVIKVRRTLKENQTEDMQCKDKIFVWNGIVTEGVQASDVVQYRKDEDKELPIVLTEITSSTSVELIKFEPPEVCFRFLPSKHLLSSIKIVNITDYHIGFNTDAYQKNAASYIMEPKCGVLRPWSTQELVVTRVAKDEAPELEDMRCEDKFYVWSGFVTEDVSASDIIGWMPKIESKELPIVFTQISSNELIQFEPPELCLPLLPNQGVLSSAKIVNITDQYIGFSICTKKSNSARYNTNPSEGILPPLSTQVVLVTRIAEENELEDTQWTEKFLVWNGIVTGDVKASDIIDKMSEIKCTHFPIVLTKTSSSTADELIKFDTPELQFPFLPKKKVMTSIKIVNLTDYNVGFNTYSRPANAAWYHTEPPRGILPPRSTQKLMLTREEKEDVLKDKQFSDKYFVWKGIVSEGVKDSDLSDCIADQESMELPIILDKICSSISSELIQFDPAEICIPLLLNKTMLFSVNVINTTDFNVAFNSYWMERIAPRDISSYENGILAPRSTKKVTLGWSTDENELEDMEANGGYFLWNRVVTERVESEDIISYMDEEESKKVPLIPNKASPCTSNELVQFDPPELSLPLMPNKPLVFSVNIVNNTDYCVGFNSYNAPKNSSWYHIKPEGGVMPPRSTQRIVVKRVSDKNEQGDMQCEDKFYLWSRLVGEGVEPNDFIDFINDEGTKELPIAYKTSLCTSDELTQFDPPQLPFTFLPNKRVSMLRKFKIVNITDHLVGFTIWSRDENSAQYVMEPEEGILLPQSTQTIKVRRTLKKIETEDMQCKDKIFVWNGIVTEGVQVSEVSKYWKDDDKELPIVLTKPGESSSR